MRIKESRHLSSDRGFTLIEIAVVLVIIGLLLGGVLKGTELIENSKVKKSVNDISSVSAAYNAYIDRYGRAPGDDGLLASLQSRGGNWSNITQAGNRNGTLAVPLNNTFNGGNEHDNFWQHLRAAGFVTGDPSLAGIESMPRNAFGGMMGITTAAVNGNLPGIKVCLGTVNGKAAQALDRQMDDGEGATGSVRATLDVNANNLVPNNIALATPYDEEATYTVCAKI